MGGLSLLALLAFFIYQNYRNKTKANQLIIAQKAELEALNATKDRLFAIIGHDLRKPSLAFRGIGKKIDYLLKKQDFETLGKLSQTLEQAAFSLNTLLDNLLNWALQQRNVLPYHPVPINVAQATQEIYEQFQTIAAQKGIDLQFHLSEDAEVFADANAFTTIMRNLVDNAIKFTPVQGQVKVSSLLQEDKVVLQIADTGIGMEEEELNTLFQLKKSKSKKGTNGEAGTGLGLVLVNELVKLNKGAIQVKKSITRRNDF
ncbi:MAG: HAMP domain-containing histidine kinase [Saprospiraceae bacterium]|nr:HAMP domain-containing histidine kinase [Saprospiraceae bacterium]